MRHFSYFFRKHPKFLSVFFSVLFLAGLGVLDRFTGPDLSLLVFYFIPTFLMTWHVGKWTGFVVAILSALICFSVDLNLPPVSVHPLLPYWNLVERLSSFLVVAYLLTVLRGMFDRERELAMKDALTEAVNRPFFVDLTNGELMRAKRKGGVFSIAYLDADDFMKLNDRFGHRAGDSCLRLIAETMKREVREVDRVGRMGGDEFGILLPDTDIEQAALVVRRIRRRLFKALRNRGWSITFSIGLVTCHSIECSIDEVVSVATGLMYSAKRSGKGAIKQDVLGQPLVQKAPSSAETGHSKTESPLVEVPQL